LLGGHIPDLLDVAEIGAQVGVHRAGRHPGLIIQHVPGPQRVEGLTLIAEEVVPKTRVPAYDE